MNLSPEKHTFEILYSSGFPTKWHSTHFGDFNGDGKTDILTYTDESSWNLAFSTGTSFSWPLITDLPFYKANPDKNELMSLFIGDFNGDGRDDILQTLAYNRDATANYNYFYISDGMGKFNLMASGEFNFKQKIAFIAKEKTIFSWYRKWASYNGHALADFNGDGKIDVLPYHGKPDAEQGVITPFANDKSNQLIAIVDGMGRETRFTYLPLTAGVSIYQKGSGATFPLIDIVAPITVVSSISQPDGIGGKTTTSYIYNGAKAHLQGKGLLGFTEVISSNNSTGLSSSLQNEFNTTFFVALPYKTTTYISGTKLSETTITNRLQDLGNKRYAHFTDKVILFKNPEGTLFTTLYTYDTYGNATNIKEVHPLRVVETTNTYAKFGGWGPSNRLTSTTVKSTYSGKPAFIRSTTYGYDTKGNLIKETTDNGITTTYTLNPAGAVTQITTTASGEATNTTKIDYDSQSRYVVKTTDALNQVTSRVVDPRTGNIREEIAINGLKTTYEYDGFGRLFYTKTPEGNIIRVNRNGNPTNGPQHCAYSIETIPDGRPKTVSYFDILGRELRSEVTGLSGVIVTDKAYNTKGQITTLTLPHYAGTTAKTTTYTYDIYGRVTTENTNGKTTTSTYSNKESNTTVATTTPAGQKYTKIYNALGNLISASDNGGSISYSYHSSGQVERINADGLITQFTYDSFGRQLSLTDPSAGKTEYTYTPTGKIKTQKDARGNLYTFNYDALGRITTCTGPQENLTYAYTTTGGGKGQIASITNSHNKTKKEYQYDSYGRITKFTDKVGEVTFTSEYQYDSNGNITKQTYPSGYAITNSYTNGYLTKVEGSNGDKIWEFGSETALGQPISYKLGNSVTVTHSYNQDMHLTGIKTGTALDYSYSFNATTGNLSWRKDNKANLQENFTYDNLNRLEKVSMGSHQQLIRYEKNGNISYKDDAGMYTYTGYKVTGINSSSNNIPSATQETAFNGFGKIDSIAEGAASIRFVYGTDRQRIKSVERQGTATTTRYYTTSHEREVTATGTTDRSYIYSPYGLAAVVEKKGDTYTTLLVSTDHLGSIVGLFTPNGNLVQKLSYDAWGNRRNPANYSQPFAETPRLRRGFTGHEHEPLFGIINMNGRLYDPVLGRFLSPDPYVQMPDFTQNFNRYSYCLNNPLVYTDPTGEYALIDDLIVMGVGGLINLGVNALQGNVNSWGEGFGYFVSGAAAAEVTIYAGPIAGGAVLGAGNNLTAQVSANGWSNINTSQLIFSSFMSGATAYVGGAITSSISPYISSWMSNITSGPVYQQAVTQSISNATSGFLIGTGISKLSGNDWDTALRDGGRGALFGGGLGLMTGAISGYKYATTHKLDPLSGESLVPESNYTVTPNGIALPKGAYIPDDLVENPYGRPGSYGKIVDGKFVETLRIDPATTPGYKGPNQSHFHLNGGKKHIFDINKWPWWNK